LIFTSVHDAVALSFLWMGLARSFDPNEAEPMTFIILVFACLAVVEAGRGIAALRYGEKRAPLLFMAAAALAAMSIAMAHLFGR
jgi:hypothetical protein